MIDKVIKLLRPLHIRIANMVARAVVQLVNDGAQMQAIQLLVLAGETREGCERFQEYGFTSVPVAGAEAVVLFADGRRDHPLIVAVDDRRYRLKNLLSGEVAIYNNAGLSVLLKSSRIVADAPELRLGSDSASDFVALASLVSIQLTQLKAAIAGAGVTAGDGGATFKATLLAALAAWPTSVAAGKVKAE